MDKLIGPAKEFLLAVLKKDGVLGVLLIALIVQNHLGHLEAKDDRKIARLDRIDGQIAYKALTDTLIRMGWKQMETTIQSSTEIATTREVVRDNTRVLQRVARRFPSRDDG